MLIAILVLLLSTPVLAATVEKTQTRTTTAELSNSAWSSGASITSNNIVFTGTVGKYVSDDWYVQNYSKGDVSWTKGTSTDRIDYAWVKGTSRWLNSTDYRKEFGGYAGGSIRLPFDDAGASTTSDAWFVGSTSINDATVIGDGVTYTGTGGARYASLAGSDDNFRVPGVYNYTGSYSMGILAKPVSASSGAGSIIGISDADSTAVVEIQWMDSTTDYCRIVVRNTANQLTVITEAEPVEVTADWHYFYLYHDQATDMYYLYVDGDLVVDGTGSGGVMTLDYISIGCVYASGTSMNNDLAGSVDEFFWHIGGQSSETRAAKASNTGAIGTYIWNEHNGITNPILDDYDLDVLSAGDSIYTCIYSVKSGSDSTVHDISLSHLNTYPYITSQTPADGYTYNADPTVTLSVSVEDVDIVYFPTMYAQFYIDDEYVDGDSDTGNSTLSYSTSSYTGGTHTWKARVFSAMEDYVWTPEYEFNVLSTLYIRDEENPDELIDDATVTVNFYTENSAITKISTNGTIDLTGLPVQDMLVTASADGYTPRKTIVTSLYDTQNIYMINSTTDIIYQKFVLNTQTISGSPTDYIIKIRKPMNGTVDTVFSSYFDFDGSCGTYLIETDVYQLVIVAPDGSESAYGYLYPDPDGQIDIAYQGITFNEYVNAWLHTNTTIDRDAMRITYAYEEAAQDNSLNPISVTEATMVITDANDNAVYNVTVSDSSYVFQYSTINDGRYTVDVEILGEDADGVEFSYTKSFVVDFIDDHFQFMPDAYPEWLKMLIVTFLCIFVLVAFGGYRSDLAAGLSFGLYAFSAYQEWISVGSLALGVMFIIVMAAFFKLQRNIKRTG